MWGTPSKIAFYRLVDKPHFRRKWRGLSIRQFQQAAQERNVLRHKRMCPSREYVKPDSTFYEYSLLPFVDYQLTAKAKFPLVLRRILLDDEIVRFNIELNYFHCCHCLNFLCACR